MLGRFFGAKSNENIVIEPIVIIEDLNLVNKEEISPIGSLRSYTTSKGWFVNEDLVNF